MLGPLRLGVCWEMARGPQRTRVIPSRRHSASCCSQPRPLWSFGAVGQCPVGSAPQVIIPVQNWGLWLCPRASGTSPLIYFRPVSRGRAGLGFQSGSSVPPLSFRC